MIVVAVDPGREKCGVAVASQETVLLKEIVSRTDSPGRVAELARIYSADRILVGNGTGSGQFIKELCASMNDVPVEPVDERYSSERARKAYLKANPAKGIRRFIPASLLYPDRPYDDYVAVILARDYFSLH
jgi:RNase H-fold protein (predicted Holliday junction resolvase)